MEIKSEIKISVYSAFIVAICFVLDVFTVFKMPFGGSIKISPMLPLIFLSFKYGHRGGGKAGLIFGILKLIFNFHMPFSQSIVSYLAVIVLEYILPYYLAGISELYSKLFKKDMYNFISAIVISEFFKFILNTVSGVFVWNDYLPMGSYLVTYCVIYNAFHILPNMFIAVIIAVLYHKVLKNTNFNHTFL